MKKKINKRSELIRIIKEEYDSISEEAIARLIESFLSGLHKLIKKKEIILYLR